MLLLAVGVAAVTSPADAALPIRPDPNAALSLSQGRPNSTANASFLILMTKK